MTDYIVGKRYRLLELHPEDSYKWEGLEYKVGVIEEIDKYGIGFRFLDGDYKTLDHADGYPKMELVEEDEYKLQKAIIEHKEKSEEHDRIFKELSDWSQYNEMPPSPTGLLSNLINNTPRTFKKHCRFKNREYKHGR